MRSCCIEVPTPHPSLQQQQVQHHGQLVWGQAGRGKGGSAALGRAQVPEGRHDCCSKDKADDAANWPPGCRSPSCSTSLSPFRHQSKAEPLTAHSI